MTIGFHLGHDLDLQFSRSSIEFAISQPKMVWLPRKANISIELNHQVWPCPPWPWIFKVKYGLCYISIISGPAATKQKANTSIELQTSIVTNGFDIDHEHDLWIFKVKCDLDLWPHTWPWPWIFMVKFWNSCISGWEELTLNKWGGNGSFMTMTIWWPRSGVRIYQIMGGVTSDVSVLSNHLVSHCRWKNRNHVCTWYCFCVCIANQHITYGCLAQFMNEGITKSQYLWAYQ